LPNIDLSFLNEEAEKRIIELSQYHDSEPANKEPGHTNRVKALLWFRMNLDKIEKGEEVEEPIFLALADSINRFAIDLVHLRDLISGMEDDLYKISYENFEDLRQYCYRAASTVGLCLVEIYGYDDPNARRHAVEMGKYLQMVNVLRDIQEDLDRGRVYLPIEEMAKFGVSKEDLHDEKLPLTEGWQEFMRHYLDHVMAHRKNAIGLLSLLDKDSRYSPSLMCAAYDAILEEAMKRNGDVLSKRLKMGLYRKLQFALGMIKKPRINLFSIKP
jgi:phytoene synthase